MNEYWIEFEADEDVLEKMEKTLSDCRMIDEWAIEEFRKIWLREKHTPYFNSISKNVSDYIYRQKMYKTQRFTLNKAVENSLRDFKSYLSADEEKVTLTLPPVREISEFKIAPRKIWIKTIEDYGYIKTYYGRLHFTGQWLGQIGNQLSEAHITYGMLPYLWHSVSIKQENGKWFLKINFHDLTSYQGKRGKKEYRKATTKPQRKEKA